MAEPQAVTPLFAPSTEIEEPATEPYVRSAADLLRLTVGVLVVLLGVLMAAGTSNATVGLDRDVLRLFQGLPDIAEKVLIVLFQVITVLIPLAVFGLVLIRRRFRLLGMFLLAGFTATIALDVVNAGILALFGEPESLQAVNNAGGPAAGSSTDSAYLAWLVAITTIASPWISARWRHAAWGMVILAALFRVVSGTNLPSDLILAIGIGMVSGSAWLLVFGAPNRRPTGAGIADAMRRSGIPLRRLTRASVDARSSAPYFAVAADGRPVFIKVLSYDDRDKNLLFRFYRFLRFKHVGDRGVFTSLRRLIEHEAFVALYANDGGSRTPRLMSATDVGDEGYLLAYQRISGDSLDTVPPDALTDGTLRRIWQEVRGLRRQRIAHRDLRLANVFLAADGQPWMIDFGFGEIAASDHMLDGDVAELLASTAVQVGPKRAVDTAVAVLGKPPVASAAPRIQPLALTRATSTAMSAHKTLCKELRDYAAEASNAGNVEPIDLQRVKPRTLLTFIALAVATYLLIPQLAGVAGNWSTIVDASWGWAAWAIVAMILSYMGGVISLKGAVPVHLPFLSTFAVKLAGAFLNRITPAGLGGMGTSVRFLQKRGIDLAVASSSVFLQTVTGMALTISLAVVFAAWAGSRGASVTQLIPFWLLYVIAGAVLALGILMLVPRTRGLTHRRLLPVLSRAGGALAEVARRPFKLAELVGGQVAANLLSITAFALSVQAFGGGVSLATLGVIYLLGTTAASAVPTPGGIGTTEVILIGALDAVGFPRSDAIPAVFLFRIVTFWLPILPGWISFTILQRRGAL